MYQNCPKNCSKPSVKLWKAGSFVRKSDSKTILRFRCPVCKSTFSQATRSPCFGQNKRRVNAQLKVLLVSGVSMRRSALILKVDLKTVARKLRFLASQARMEQEGFLNALAKTPVSQAQFDDLETIEHTKCKPLSVSLAVEKDSRKILALEVAKMPAKGPLASISVKKYGPREDQRAEALSRLFLTLRVCVKKDAYFLSDKNPFYPRALKQVFPESTHRTVKGQRGCVSGQGELKKIVFDPLFSLNHCCAMLRANISRLLRRIWNTTKKVQCLEDHLALYLNFHNQVLT